MIKCENASKAASVVGKPTFARQVASGRSLWNENIHDRAFFTAGAVVCFGNPRLVRLPE